MNRKIRVSLCSVAALAVVSGGIGLAAIAPANAATAALTSSSTTHYTAAQIATYTAKVKAAAKVPAKATAAAKALAQAKAHTKYEAAKAANAAKVKAAATAGATAKARAAYEAAKTAAQKAAAVKAAAIAAAKARRSGGPKPTVSPSPTTAPTAAPSPTTTPTPTPTAAPTPTPTAAPSPTSVPSPTPTTVPTPTPTTPPSTGSDVQPGPNNTGVPAGTALTVYNGDLMITTAGATYSGLDIHGYLRVEAPNVTVKDSVIRGGTGPIGNGIVSDTTAAATNFLLEDSEIVPQYPVVGLDDIKGWNYTALRDNIYGSVDGLKMYGDNATVEDSYIHDLVTYAHDPAQNNGPSHSDGVQILSGNNLNIIGNTIVGQTNSSIMVTQDHGAVNNVLINGNWLSAQGAQQVSTINVLAHPMASLSGITITNNVFYGQMASACQILDSTDVTMVQSNNTIQATGKSAKFLNTAANG